MMRKNLMFAIGFGLAMLGSSFAARAEEGGQAALLKALGDAKLTLAQGIAQVAKGTEVPTEAKYEMDHGKLMLTVYTSAKGFDTAPEDNAFNEYGGDDGLNIARHSDFGAALNLDRPVVFYYFAYGLLLLFLFLGNRIVQSRFGMLLQGVKSNERRMIALGFPTFRYKLTAFVMAGAVCGIAGALFANLTLFVSPSIMHWTRSGEIMMMVILGGLGSLVGPVFGAAAYLILESVLSRLTEHWQAVLGPILILVVLFSKTGLYGIFVLPRRRSG